MTELLAPAGSVEAFEVAIRAGADAVYLGGERFGARAYAANFDEKTLLSVIDRAHLFGKKIYLTVNTLIKESEMQELVQFILPYYKAGLDAVIIQDLGAVKMVRTCFPGLHIHASTQMTVTGFHGASFLRKNGVDRVIPARELSLEEIKEIRAHSDIEIECFIHGALCYCYSGQCLMSSTIGGRSGNRGRCAQPCRLPYTVFAKGKELSGAKNAYALNTKDICTVEILPQIIGAGVDSLKIEGRMKRPEYTAGVVSVYRKYLDLFEAGEEYRVDPEDLRFLFDLFNRDGFSQSYYQVKNGPEMMALQNKKQSEEGLRKADRRYETIRETILSAEPKIVLTADVCITKKKAEVTLREEGSEDEPVKTVSEEVSEAQKHALTEEVFLRQLEKTGGTAFVIKPGKIGIEPGVFMTVKAMNELRRNAVFAFERGKTGVFRRKLSKPFETDHRKLIFLCDNIENHADEEETGEPQISVLVLTEEQLEAALSLPEIRNVEIPISRFAGKKEKLQEIAERVKKAGKNLIIQTSPVSRNPDRRVYRDLLESAAESGADFLCGSLEDITLLAERGLAERIRTDAGAYTFNSVTQRFFGEMGITRDTVPLELSSRELKNRNNRNSELVVYGRIPLMVSAQCLQKNYDCCTKENRTLYLKDRKNYTFPVVCDCVNCQNILYNAVPLSLLAKKPEILRLRPESVRFSFTDEDADTLRKRLAAWISEDTQTEDFEFTRGHYTKGAE